MVSRQLYDAAIRGKIEAAKSAEDDRAKSVKHRVELIEAQNENLDLIIDAFGLRDAYPDVRNPEGYWQNAHSSRYHYSHGYWVETVTPGRDQFLADIKAVAQSKSAKDAKKRLGL